MMFPTPLKDSTDCNYYLPFNIQDSTGMGVVRILLMMAQALLLPINFSGNTLPICPFGPRHSSPLIMVLQVALNLVCA